MYVLLLFLGTWFCLVHTLNLEQTRYAPGSIEHSKGGSALAGGWSGLLFAIQGDMDYFSNILKLPRWQTKKNCCILCKAGADGTNSWKNFSREAPWVSTCWTPASWHLFEEKSLSPIFHGVPGSSALLCALDFMHNKYLGSDQYIMGSTMILGGYVSSFFLQLSIAIYIAFWIEHIKCTTSMWKHIFEKHLGAPHFLNSILAKTRYLLVYHILSHGSPLQNLLYLEKLIMDYYKENPSDCQYKHMSKLTMFMRKVGGPKLRGKAIEIRSFGPPLLFLWQKFHNPNVQMHKNILLLLKLSLQVDSILEMHKGDHALPPESAKQFQEIVFSMGHVHILLENHFNTEEGIPHLFTATSKMHGLAHAALWSQYISPRAVWCFMGEDYMHHVQVLAESCVAGTGPYLTVNKVVDKMRVALHVQFTKGDK